MAVQDVPGAWQSGSENADGDAPFDYDACKLEPQRHGTLRYRLRNSEVWVGRNGFHHTAHLDPSPEAPADAPAELDPELAPYIERNLEFSRSRFETHVRLVESVTPVRGARVLDVGCGGGLFLALLAQRGADVVGLEVDPARAAYARDRHGLHIECRPVESERLAERYAQGFDVVTLWDVIEHVNFPQRTLAAARRLLRPGGHLLIDTPCRDSFYHRVGKLTYALSGGRYPTFLDIMYSDHPFGHKQIFATGEMRDLLKRTGFEVQRLEKFHELSFPNEFYLTKLLRSKSLVRVANPMVSLLLKLIRVRNKMLVIARPV